MFVHPELHKTSHVFYTSQCSSQTITTSLVWTLKVFRHQEKFFGIETSHRKMTISVDKLKPAFLLNFQELVSPDIHKSPEKLNQEIGK